MAKTVGFSRNIKLSWLNKAADLYGEKLDEKQYKAAMNEYLAFEISSPTNLRKTREILMRVWFYENKEIDGYRAKAYKLLRHHEECDAAIHWCMLLLVFPVFTDICRLMGRIADFNEVIVLKQLKQKLYDEWGERSTLYHSTDKIIATMKDLGAISAVKPGAYQPAGHEVRNNNVVKFLICTAMNVDGGSYYTFEDLDSFNVLFPFKYSVSKEMLMDDDVFTITNFGGELTITLKNI